MAQLLTGEDRVKHTPCGYVLLNSEFMVIVGNSETGDCILRHDIDGDYVISEVNASNPMYVTEETCESICRSKGVDGVIMTNSYLYLIRGDKVSAYAYTDTNKELMSFPFSYDVQYDGDIDDEAYGAED